MDKYVNQTLIPNLVEREEDETGDNYETMETVLKNIESSLFAYVLFIIGWNI